MGSADWNLWPLGMEYETTFPLFHKLGIEFLELGIYTPSIELEHDRIGLISTLQEKHSVEVTAALFSLTPNLWPNGAFSNSDSNFLAECEIFFVGLQNLGIKFANIWTGADGPNSNIEATMITLEKLNKLASSFNGIVSIEYKSDTIFPDGASLSAMLQNFDSLKVLVDTGHAFAIEEDIVKLIKELHLRGLLGSIHLGDAVPGDSDADLPCGRVHDFSPIVDALEEINFSGSANFDLYGAAVDPAGPGPEKILIESLHYLESLLASG